jgi:hypothetical protein
MGFFQWKATPFYRPAEAEPREKRALKKEE